MIETIRDYADQLPEFAQWLILVVLGAIPYVEGYGAAFIGVIAGVPLPLAVLLGVIGNVLSMLAFMKAGHAVHRRRTDPEAPLSARQQKLHRALDKWGVAVVSLIGPTILPSQLTAAGLVGFGARRQQVIMWTVISIVLWAVVFAFLAMGFISAFA